MIPLPNINFLSGFNNFVIRYGNYIAGSIFIIASLTDSIDGHIARSRNMITNFGKFLDPVADKLLVTAALLALVQTGRLNGWFAFIIIGRELLITGFRLVVSGMGTVIAANNIGKAKMVFQTIAIAWLIFEPGIEKYYFWKSPITPGMVLMGIAVILTVISGYVYIRDNIHFIKKDV